MTASIIPLCGTRDKLSLSEKIIGRCGLNANLCKMMDDIIAEHEAETRCVIRHYRQLTEHLMEELAKARGAPDSCEWNNMAGAGE